MLSHEQRRRIAIAGGILAGAAVLHYLELLERRAPYHDSILTGEKWLIELLTTRNHHRFYEQLGLSKETFLALVKELEEQGLITQTRYISTEEQVAIFLYTMVTNLPNRKVAERFQRSGETISRVFHKQPTLATPLPPDLELDPKFTPYFKNAIGAIDGVHTSVSPLEADRARCRNRKGQLSLNHLAACNFDMEFTYILAGWEGSAADGFLFAEAVQNFGLAIPAERFYLADAGFGMSQGMLVPFRGVHYHLREWGAGNEKPRTRNELYNLRHATYQNVVERIFGVMKRRWRIICETNSFDLRTNAKIFAGLAALHNFIRKHDHDDLPEPWDEEEEEEEEDPNHEAANVASSSSVAAGTRLREQIAEIMWKDYQAVINRRNANRRAQAARRRSRRALHIPT